jgi:hypothetical protein
MSTNGTRLHTMQLTYMIDGYDRCRQQKLPSMPSHERKLYDMTNSDNDLRRDIRATGIDGRRSIGSVWKWRYGGWDHFWMFSSFSLLFFSSLDLGPVQMASARVFTTCQWRWGFPVRRVRRKVAIQLYRSVVGLMGSYNCVRRMIVSFFVALSCFSLILALAAQEVCA